MLLKAGIEKIEQTTITRVAGLTTMGEGAAIGTILGLLGSIAGGFIVATVAYMAGANVDETILKGAQKIRDTPVLVVKNTIRALYNTCKNTVSFIEKFFND